MMASLWLRSVVQSRWEASLRIDRGVIAEVLAKTDLVSLIGTHVALQRRGQHFIGLCPFHSERTPSFNVRQDRGFFKCFGCGVGGDAIRFIERMENMTFPEALRELASRVGVQLAEETPFENKQRALREAIAAANSIAALFYHRTLLNAPEAEAARAYCAGRGLDAAALEHFRLGYAPDSWEALREVLLGAGVDEQVAMQAGLLKAGQRGMYDFYRNRLMIPTVSVTGEVVAFGGRSLDGSEPKYINTTTTPLYTKGKMLYGMNFARRAAGIKGALIVVEGYLDCIAMHRAGFEHTVASLGTACTPEQADILRRYVTNVYLAYDGDAAGLGATDKALEILETAGIKARVLDLPTGEDPDSFLRKHGVAAMDTALAEAPRSSEFRIDRRLAAINDGFRTPGEQAAEVERFIASEPLIERDRLRLRVAQKLGLSIEDVRRAAKPATPQTVVRNDRRRIDVSIPPPSRDREIISLFLDEPQLINEYRAAIPADRMRDSQCRRFYELLLAHETIASSTDVLVAVSEDEEASAVLLSLAGEERSQAVRFADGTARRAHLDRVVEFFAREDDERRRREIDQEVDALLTSGAPVPEQLIAEQKAIQARLTRVLRQGEK